MIDDKYESNITRAERRHRDWTKAIRKKKISDSWSSFSSEYPYYDNLHQYSKNKIHCSCGMCSRCTKTNNKGPKRRKIHGNYAPSYNPSLTEKRKNESMIEQIEEYEVNNE